MSFFTVYCMVGAVIALPPMADKEALVFIHKTSKLPPILTTIAMFIGFTYCILIWPCIAYDLIIAGKAKNTILRCIGLCMVMAGIMGMYSVFCWYFSSDIRTELHGHAIPAGQYQHIPGASDYDEFKERNK